MHILGQAVVSPSNADLITSYVTPTRGGAECVGAILWGEIYADFYVYKNGVYVCGGRTSAASPTLQLDWSKCPLELSGGDVLLVMGEPGGDSPKSLKAVLLVTLL